MNKSWNTVLAVIVTAVVVGGGVYYWQNSQLQAAMSDRNEFLVATLDLFEKGDGLVLIEQSDGRTSDTSELERSGPAIHDTSVLVDHVLLTQSGYLEVFKTSSDEPNAIFGRSETLSAGRHDDVTISLTEPLSLTDPEDPNSMYVVALYHDSMQEEDSVATDEMGKPVETYFTVSN